MTYLAQPLPEAVATPRRCCGCTRQMPDNMLEAAGRSFLFSTVSGTLLTGGNIVLGFCSGVGSMIASLVDSLIRPLINLCYARENRRETDWSPYFWTKLSVTAVIYGSLIALVSPLIGIPLEIGVIASIATRIFLGLFPGSGVCRVDDPQELPQPQAEVFTFLFV